MCSLYMSPCTTEYAALDNLELLEEPGVVEQAVIPAHAGIQEPYSQSQATLEIR